MRDECFDVFNAQGDKIAVAPRAEVHRRGLWHQTFHCWVLAYERTAGWRVLVQLRQWDKDIFPNLLDISCAGHLQAGEEIADGVRELEEELGLAVSFDRLHPCGVVAVEHLLTETLIDRELSHVFLLREDRVCQDYLFQKSEISGLFHIQLEAFRGLLTGTLGTASATGVAWMDGAETLEASSAVGGKWQSDIVVSDAELPGGEADHEASVTALMGGEVSHAVSCIELAGGLVPSLKSVRRDVTLADLVPHPLAYYRFVLEEMDKFLADERNVDER